MVRYTRQHFKDVARIVSQVSLNERVTLAEKFCHLFISENQNFDVDKFLDACEIPR